MAKNSNIPMYNDQRMNKEIEQRRKQEEQEKRRQEEARRKAEKQAIKQSRFHISEIPFAMLFSIFFMISIIGVSFYMNSFQYILYSILGIPVTAYIGKRLKFVFDETLNILVWNISQTFKDFIDYKLKLDFFTGSESRIKKSSVSFMIVLILLNSNNVIYGLVFIIAIISYMIGFANREMSYIANGSKMVCTGAMIGLIVKTIVYSLLGDGLSIDFMNIIMIIIFSAINIYAENLPIYEPQE